MKTHPTLCLVALMLALANCCFLPSVHAQAGGILAGQTAGMSIVYANNLFFSCPNNGSTTQCTHLDVDGDGNFDFDLARQYSSSVFTEVWSLAPTTWQVLNDSTSSSSSLTDASPIPNLGIIHPRPRSGTWKPRGRLCIDTDYWGRFSISGTWAQIDTLTRYIGIRKLQSGRWFYGYLKTKRLSTGSNSLSPSIYVTAYAMQSGVITGVRQRQLVGVDIYPNPVQHVLQLNLPSAARLRIYNAVGGLQYEEQLAPGAAQVSVAKWASGIYLLRLENASGVYTHRLQKTE